MKWSKSSDSDRHGSHLNDYEEASSQSETINSNHDLRNTSRMEERLNSNERKPSSDNDGDDDDDDDDDDDNDDDEKGDCFSEPNYRKKSSRKTASKTRLKDNSSRVSSSEMDNDSKFLEYKKNNRQSRTTEKKHERLTNYERKKQKERRRQKGKSDELPITEILKKAQEHRRKYEEPTPLPELTTNIIYVQSKNGFNAIKISESTKFSSANREERQILLMKPAISFQKFWHSIGYICQGLLGGMALLHFIFIETIFHDYKGFVHNYSLMLEIYSSIFSLCIAICIVSVFDKFDICHIGEKYVSKVIKYHLISIISVPLYITVFILHQITSKSDDKLMLLHYHSMNKTNNVIQTHSNTSNERNINLMTWQYMAIMKDFLSLLGWIFVSLDNHKDMLLSNLENLNHFNNVTIEHYV